MSRLLTALACGAILTAAASPSHSETFQISWPGGIFIDEHDGHIRARLTEDGRTIKFEAEGDFELATDESDLVRLAPGATFRVEERRHGSTQRKLVARGLDAGAIERQFEFQGTRREMTAEDHAWLQDVMGVLLSNTTFAVKSHVARLLAQGGTPGALEAIAKMPSEHVQGDHYRELVSQRSDPETACLVARSAAASISGSHELGEVLRAVVDRADRDRSVALACAEASEKISGDYERRRTLRAVVDGSDPDPAVSMAVTRSVSGIGSDHDRAEVLIALAQHGPLSAIAAPSFFEAASGIGSDHELARVLREVTSSPGLPEEVLLGVLESAKGISSDHEQANLLVDLADNQHLEGAVRDAYLDAAQEIGSSRERARVLEAAGELSFRHRH